MHEHVLLHISRSFKFINNFSFIEWSYTFFTRFLSCSWYFDISINNVVLIFVHKCFWYIEILNLFINTNELSDIILHFLHM